MLGMCFDKRVLGGLALVGVGVLVFAPNLFTAALPLLFIAICPLSMLFMGKAMMGGGKRAELTQQEPGLDMAAPHAFRANRDLTSAGPGQSPESGLTLGPISSAQPIDASYVVHPVNEANEKVALLQRQLQRVSEEQAALAQQIARLQDAVELPEPSVPGQDFNHTDRAATAREAKQRQSTGPFGRFGTDAATSRPV